MKGAMVTSPRVIPLSFCLAGLALFGVSASLASNGMNMIGYGAESVGMAGADLAVTDNPSSMNINPAGVAWCEQPEFDFGLGFMNPTLTHTDMLGNNVEDTLDRPPVPFIGYVHPIGDFTAGVGLFAQGGLGVEYNGLITPFAALMASGNFPPGFWDLSVVPETDTVKTELANVRLTPAFGWRIGPKVTVGATLNVSYAQADMEFLPETSVLADFDMSGVPGDSPGEMFAGIEVDDVSTYGFGLRLGAQYKGDKLAIGGAYSTETDLDFDGGTATLNLPMLGKVVYDAEMTDFAWPRQLGAGFAYQITQRLLIASDLDWIDWSSAIRNPTIRLSNPDNQAAPPSREITFPMSWDDQWVWALGFELKAAERWVARFGYNHGDTPIPEDQLRPQFPAVAEDHLTGGFGYASGKWIFDFALEYVFESKKTNNNPDMTQNPFGPGSTETLSQIAAQFTVRRMFGAKR
jgi:long-chain fatty acid transport protein